MIKINLLPEGIKQAPRRDTAETSPLGISPAVFLAASAVLCFAIVGAVGWYWSRETARLEQDMKKERAEQGRLAAIQKENLLYQKQMEELEQRVRAIQALQENRTGPADFMTALGATVNQTRDLCLLSIGPGASGLVLKGESPSARSIAGFIAALKHSGSFGEVKLRQYYQEDQGERVDFKFDLECAYGPPGVPAVSAKTETSPTSAARGGP